MKKQIEEMTLDEKIDKILKYQKRLHHMAVVRAIFSFLTFFVIVVLPIIGILYLGEYITNTLGLSMEEIGETLKRVQSLTELGGLDGLKNFLN